MNKLHIFAFSILVASLFAGCESATNTVQPPPGRPTLDVGNDILVTGNKAIVLANGSNSLFVVDLSKVSSSDRELLILNEGFFGKNNSTLDAILFHKDGAKIDTIVKRNILPDSTQLLLATIPMSLDAPSKMAIIGPNLLLVTRRSANTAAIVDLTTYKIVDSVKIGEPSIAVAIVNNVAYVTSGATSYTGPYHVNMVDPASHNVTSRYEIAGSPEQAVPDSSNNHVVISTPGDFSAFPATFYYTNPKDSIVVGRTMDDIEILTGPVKYAINSTGIVQLQVIGLGSQIVTSSTPYYKGFFDALSNELYLGISDFTSGAGKIDVYDATTGTFKWSQTTGIAPGHFAFYH